nr:U32 family peptidase [Muribaculaceae bacterium]
CQASLITTGRSANRGCCAQICRLPYSLTDRDGNVLVNDRHLLSLRDMSRIDHLGAMIDAGISSFKIEGRLKDVGYVKNTVTAYRKALDLLIDQSKGALTRSSSGSEIFRFAPDLTKSFNRGFTPYFIDGKRDKMAATESPKWIGIEIGTVKGVKGTRITLNTDVRINNGDGLGFFNSDNKLEGFRVNRCDGKSLFTSKPINIAPGTVIYRNHDKAWDDMLAGSTAERYIPIDITLRPVTWGIAVDITDSDGNSVTIASELQTEPANTSQTEARQRTFSKLGDTIYRLNNFDDRLGDIFIPASRLTAIRREAISALDSARSAAYRYNYRRPRICDSAQNPTSKLTYHDNVANRKAELFYRSCGVSTIEKALEVATPSNGEIRVMTTRYCLRHEMGQCLRQSGTQWRNPLYLQAQGFRFRLDFDCRSCAMHVIAERPDSCS